MVPDLLLLFIAVYAGHLAAYVGLGLVLDGWNRRNPARRIQKMRRGEARRAVEIRQSLIALGPISALMSIGIWAQVSGFTLWQAPALTLWEWLGMLGLVLVLFDAWFYWAHRLMHLPGLYRFHKIHHLSKAPTVWSTYSDHPVDAVAHQGFLLIAPLLLPIPPSVLIAHRLIDHINGTVGHSGYEYFASPGARMPSPGLCTTFHDQHHERFTVNYGNFLSIWDRMMGTISADYDDQVRAREEA
ncbi:MAG: sterol desaturase family protein [Pseudomonadota bacterium]